MSKPSRKRQRELAKQKARKEREANQWPKVTQSPVPEPPGGFPELPPMRATCPTCGLTFDAPDLIHGLSGPGDISNLTISCPVDGTPSPVINSHEERRGDTTYVRWANGPEDIANIRALVDFLSGFDQDASAEEVAAEIERHAPGLQVVADYVRENSLALAGLGVGVAGVVVALLAWLFPISTDDAPPPPAQIEKQDLDRIVGELRLLREQTAAQADDDQDAARDRLPKAPRLHDERGKSEPGAQPNDEPEDGR